MTGSSPHTRGLRRDVPLRAVACGIIPAHAGFTSRSQSSSRWSSDHPRTRGVYVAVTPATGAGAGSSPHTRGLQLGDGVTIMGDRIIPAHAGFTVYRPPAHASAQDHPRTRGVYRALGAVAAVTTGSSPHTRGLHRRAPREDVTRRIIPAHARFTGHRDQRHGGPTDHPRTRGVYLTPSRTVSFRAGSSPHTRGLPERDRHHIGLVRIIPAHAGFTGGPS